MIHWFTRNTQYESPDTIALLDSILVSFMAQHADINRLRINTIHSCKKNSKLHVHVFYACTELDSLLLRLFGECGFQSATPTKQSESSVLDYVLTMYS